MGFSSISLLTFTMERESELRASDAFIAKWLITSEVFSLCNCGCKLLNLKIRQQMQHNQYAELQAVLECLFR